MEFSSVSSDSFLVVIKEIVNLILHAAFFHEAHCIEARDVKAEPCFWYQKIHFSLSNGIERWLSTFGGEMLGGSKRHVVGVKDSWKQKAKVELKVLIIMLTILTITIYTKYYANYISACIAICIKHCRVDKVKVL